MANVKPKKITKARANKEFELGRKAAKAGDWHSVAKHLLVAWEVYSDDLPLLTVLSHALVQLGARSQAIELLEKTLQRHKATPDICAIMLQMALEMTMYDVAVKIGRILIEIDPQTPGHYINLASALAGAEEYDAGISMLQAVIPMFPEVSGLWNVLGSLVQQRDGREASKAFFHESIRLDPKNFKAYSNLAGAEEDQTKRHEIITEAIKLEPKNPEPHLINAFCLMHMGRLKEAFKEYEFRMDPSRKLGQSLSYTHKVPRWDGSSLAGKTLMVTGEQGIGDEVAFAPLLHRVYKEAEKLYIGCEPRLVSIFQREFPNAVVARHATKSQYGYIYRSFPEIEYAMRDDGLEIDWAVPIASLPGYFWEGPEDIEEFPDGYLSADPALATEFAKKIAGAGKGLKVGIVWRSGNITGIRKRSYLNLEQMLPILATKGVTFFSLQYTNVREELEAFEKEHGIKIHTFDGVDMKNDIESNLAIMANLDLVLGAPTSPLSFAASLGVRTWWMCEMEPWWRYGFDGGRPKFLPQGKYFTQGEERGNWDKPVEDVRAALADMLDAG